MKGFFCDVCGKLIKDTKWDVRITERARETNFTVKDDLSPFNFSQQRYSAKYEDKDLCDTCKKVMDYLFALRKEEVEALIVKTEEYFNEKEKKQKSK